MGKGNVKSDSKNWGTFEGWNGTLVQWNPLKLCESKQGNSPNWPYLLTNCASNSRTIELLAKVVQTIKPVAKTMGRSLQKDKSSSLKTTPTQLIKYGRG